MDVIEFKDSIFDKIKEIIESARKNVSISINQEMVNAYWSIGKLIVEDEQQGEQRANYGTDLLNALSKKLTLTYGKGFDTRNLYFMRRFFLTYPKLNALRSILSWTHYRILMKIENHDKRSFYEIECAKNKWATRELDRQICSLLFERLALSRGKDAVMQMALEGQIMEKTTDLVKDPYVLEFLELNQNDKLYEKKLEQALIEHLQEFLLELGRGFSFVARQKRISMEDEHFYIDLVFYNYILKCFVLVDLKIGRLAHQDIGQMQMYVNYYTREMMNEGDNLPIGIVLCADKSEAVVKYTLSEQNTQIFASRYKLYLPSEEELRAEIIKEKKMFEIVQNDEKYE